MMQIHFFFTDLLETLAQNGKPPDENDSHVNGDGPTMRHRSHGEKADVSAQGSTDSKPYSAEQLEAVRKSVHTCSWSLALIITCLLGDRVVFATLSVTKCFSQYADWRFGSYLCFLGCGLWSLKSESLFVNYPEACQHNYISSF